MGSEPYTTNAQYVCVASLTKEDFLMTGDSGASRRLTARSFRGFRV